MTISTTLFSFSGRIPRSTYWMANLGIMAALFVCGIFAGIIAASGGGHRSSGSSDAAPFVFLFLPLYLLALWAGLAVSVKRWHDRGKSGLWVLIGFIPYIGWAWSLIELGFLEGTPGPNQYGDGLDVENMVR